mgnify:CR=1
MSQMARGFRDNLRNKQILFKAGSNQVFFGMSVMNQKIYERAFFNSFFNLSCPLRNGNKEYKLLAPFHPQLFRCVCCNKSYGMNRGCVHLFCKLLKVVIYATMKERFHFTLFV